MLKVNIHEAKARLSHYLERLKAGDTIVICKRNVPVAELRRLPGAEKRPRPLGLGKARFKKVPPAFFKPLPGDLMDAFEGRGR